MFLVCRKKASDSYPFLEFQRADSNSSSLGRWGNAETKEKKPGNNSAAIKQSPNSSTRDIRNNIFLNSSANQKSHTLCSLLPLLNSPYKNSSLNTMKEFVPFAHEPLILLALPLQETILCSKLWCFCLFGLTALGHKISSSTATVLILVMHLVIISFLWQTLSCLIQVGSQSSSPWESTDLKVSGTVPSSVRDEQT